MIWLYVINGNNRNILLIVSIKGCVKMICRIAELRHKEVINSSNGCRLGFADDVEIDTVTSQIVSIVVFGRPRCFGLFGRNEDLFIPWCDISLIGEDTILVNHNVKYQQKKSKVQKIFSK